MSDYIAPLADMRFVIKELVGLDLIQPQSSGRSAHYVWQPAGIDRRFGGIG